MQTVVLVILKEQLVSTKSCTMNKSCTIVSVISKENTAWKESKYGVISGPYLPAFSPNTGKYEGLTETKTDNGLPVWAPKLIKLIKEIVK